MATQKKIPAYRMCTFVLYLVLMIFSISATPIFALENKASEPHYYDTGKADNRITTISHTQGEKETPSHLIWIIGEIALAIITAIILLIIYSWHLRTVVSKKTRELKKLNAFLEDKVQERTAELEKSKEAYKAMYAHAEDERKQTKVALESEREAIKQNSNFMDMISHEYRTPLSVISSSIELIERKCELNDFRELDGQIKKMTLSTQRLMDIFESALGKDRLDTLAPQLQIGTLSLVHIIQSATELVKTVYTDYQIIFKNKPHEEILITGDEKLLVTVFKNILDNACKYSGMGEPIYILVDVDQDHANVEILDSGIGIDENEIGSVFEKYFRSDHTGKRQGAGLGLFLVKTIVELHNGDVKLESERNIGTKLTVCLPR